jgi:hypothetical protein
MARQLEALGLRPPKNWPSRTGDGHALGAGAAEKLSEAMAQWREARRTVVDALKVVGARASKSQHKDAPAAFIEIQAVVKNLARDPFTVQQVQELEVWLRDDAVVADVDEFGCRVRAPLLAPLTRIRTALGVR